MQPGVEATRNIEEELEDLDETDSAIERAGKRIEAQEQRIAQLKREGTDSESAEKLLGDMRDSLKQLIMHRALIVKTIACRE
ncbi:hypothetical protein AB4156_24830 [Cupriavidus sp. 2MCAB6]|uniref:hypothetical protein n=1 Tax=Cupriavidus sp. 2MCAB6 TaxID=3232981 RepID=UPI003F8E4BB5